jgi:hypothetical protein
VSASANVVNFAGVRRPDELSKGFHQIEAVNVIERAVASNSEISLGIARRPFV